MVLADRRIGQFCAIGHVAAHAARRSRGAGLGCRAFSGQLN
jgi:hypothetical protein